MEVQALWLPLESIKTEVTSVFKAIVGVQAKEGVVFLIGFHILCVLCDSIARLAVKPFYRNPDIRRVAMKARSAQGRPQNIESLS